MIDHRTSYIFPLPGRITGFIFIPVGLFLTVINPVFGVGLTLAGLFLALGASGAQIDPEKDTYKDYFGVLFLKFGSWKPLTEFPFLALLNSKKSQSTLSRGNRRLTMTEEFYGVYLIGEVKSNRLLIFKTENMENGEAELTRLASLLDKKVLRPKSKA